jgi:hypothetical protein
VCRYRNEVRTRDFQVCKYVYETQSREVPYTVCVPEQRSKTVQLTRYNSVPEQKTVTVNVCVPEQVTEQVPVRVCHMVEKVIEVPACGGCGGCCN